MIWNLKKMSIIFLRKDLYSPILSKQYLLLSFNLIIVALKINNLIIQSNDKIYSWIFKQKEFRN